MSGRAGADRLDAKALRLLALLSGEPRAPDRHEAAAARALVAADLAAMVAGALTITSAGWAHLARHDASRRAPVAAFRVQHMTLENRDVDVEGAMTKVLADADESPLAWLARRKGRDGRAMIAPAQFLAGERLRADFTRAQMMPRVTSNWASPVARGQGGVSGLHVSELAMAARQRVRRALDAVGPEFAGPLLDICCFLQGLEDVERARGWPPRSAKIVLQLGLDRLARHYGLAPRAHGPDAARIVTWLADGAVFTSEG